VAARTGLARADPRREEEIDAEPSSTTRNEGAARNPRAPKGLRRRRPACCVVAPQRWHRIACVANALHPGLRRSQRGRAVLPRRLL